MKLEKLKKIDLRKAWNHEATDFTNCLAEEENLSLLSDEIGTDIKLIQTEASVGKFSVDILAEEENTGRKIIIENQLEMTNHEHLGKIITYASGYDAEIIIWIIKDVRDEHKQAVDWLNEHTDDKINFFAIKMELWQIGNSPFAPKFQIISKPNDWAKAIKKSTIPQQILTDNGVQFTPARAEKGPFTNWCEEKRIKHILGRVHHPQTNGKIERWFGTYKTEFDERFETLDAFLKFYNEVRIHQSIGFKRPIERFSH